MLLPYAQRPHPCLVFAMYTLAASTSYIPAVRGLSEGLYGIALVKLNESINHEDRLLDAIRAASMLAKWTYSKSRVLEGYQLGCRAISLVPVPVES